MMRWYYGLTVKHAMGAIRINDQVRIEEGELRFTASRSPGPGGQNVNKVATKVTLWFDVATSLSLTEPQRQRLCRRLASRIDRRGVLHLSASSERTQSANRRAVVERFAALLAGALRVPKTRKPTKPTAASRARRLEIKTRRSDQKRRRRVPRGFDE